MIKLQTTPAIERMMVAFPDIENVFPAMAENIAQNDFSNELSIFDDDIIRCPNKT